MGARNGLKKIACLSQSWYRITPLPLPMQCFTLRGILGGALAQFAAYEYAEVLSNSERSGNFDLVTFNALGGVLALDNPVFIPKDLTHPLLSRLMRFISKSAPMLFHVWD